MIVGEVGERHTTGLFRKSIDPTGLAAPDLEEERIVIESAVAGLACLLVGDAGRESSLSSLMLTGLSWCA